MASIRITTNMKSEIVSKILKGAFDAREKATKDKSSVLIRKIADFHITDKNLALMKQLPLSYFHSRENVTIIEPNTGINATYIYGSESVRLPADVGYNGRVEVPITHSIWKEVRALHAEGKQCDNDKNELREKVRGLIDSVSTVKALLDAWPEVAEYLPEFEEKKNLPAVRAEELNSFIAGLKK